MKTLSFVAKLERDKDGTWWYVHVPAEIRQSFKPYEKRGIVSVTATVGATSWPGSMLPWADGSAQISVNKAVRTKEHLVLGQDIMMMIQPRIQASETTAV